MKAIYFENYDAFSDWVDNARENDINIDGIFTAVIDKDRNSICYDGQTVCKSPKTALKRLSKAFPELSWIADSVTDDNYLGEKYLIPDCDSYIVENLDGEDLWYVAARMYNVGD